ncbi:MAG: FkbM family methyltransferase [Acidobacteria bacterium]|nr:FkbM family methyltransferase [Acidobacteriota bacterium]
MFFLTKIYVLLYGWVQDRFGIQLKGLGFFLRLNRRDRNFSIHGQTMRFDHRVAAAYCRLVAGSWNEPETHLFLDTVIGGHEGPVTFIDVGASVGEFVIDVARHTNVARIVAFEPIEECAEAVRRSAELNGRRNVEVIGKLVNEDGRPGVLRFEVRRPTAASTAETVEGVSRDIPATTLDLALGGVEGTSALLIDVEGAEPGVLRGGREFLRRCAPLIIFEFNATSREHFSLDDIRGVLGEGWKIYRLTRSGTLDLDFERSWNCVAVSAKSPFGPVCENLFHSRRS